MTRTFKSLELFVVSCLCLTFESHTSKVCPPQNVSLDWKTDFEPRLSWKPPQHSAENCTYELEWSRNQTDDKSTINLTNLTWSKYIVMDGEPLYFSVKTICNGKYSEPVEKSIIYQELVRNLSCYVQSSKLTRCSWVPVSDAADIGFFFRLTGEDLSVSSNSKSSTPLRACPAYTDGRTGCDLQAGTKHAIHILFNGTLNNKPARNTFKIWLKCNARPLPLNLTVVKAEDTFKISWIPPDFDGLSNWKFTIRQTACNKKSFHDVEDATSTTLSVVSHCENCLAIKVKRKGTEGESEWSDDTCFGAGSQPSALVYAAIIIPLMFAVLAALTLVCCKKNKDIIFPRIPEPLDFLSDISDNNNKITVRNLYIPPEEEDCKITLVIDPINNKLIS